MKERLLDKDTIETYHAYVQAQIKSDLNSISLGPGKLPIRLAWVLVSFGLCCLLVGVLLITLRMRHVYLSDWDAQFLGPFFFVMFLLCMGGTTYLVLIATRRSNRFRRDLFFHPLGDYGITAVHKDDLIREHDLKHDLKSGTTPHKNVMPRSEAYSQMNPAKEVHTGHRNQGYRSGPAEHQRRPGDYHRPPADRSRGHSSHGGRGGPIDDRRKVRDEHRKPPVGEYRQPPPPPPPKFASQHPRDDPMQSEEHRHGPSMGRHVPPPRDDQQRGASPLYRGGVDV